jgi:AcrR family transcriptional regulator
MTGGRANQKARTREAILSAAIEILREGREPTVPEAAERARVSPATAYRYFTSVDDLQDEASAELLSFMTSSDEVGAAIEAAGDDVHARLEMLVRTLGWRMLTDQAPFRQQAKAGHERWFAHQQAEDEAVEVRVGRRTRFIRQVLEPLQDRMADPDLERLVAALVVGFGTEAATSLTDVARLGPAASLEVMVVTCRWILDGALGDAGLRQGGDRETAAGGQR